MANNRKENGTNAVILIKFFTAQSLILHAPMLKKCQMWAEYLRTNARSLTQTQTRAHTLYRTIAK